MKKSLNNVLSASVVCGLFLLCAPLANAGDGLYRITGSVLAEAWVKPGVDLGRYTKIMVLPVGMSFRDVPRHSRDAFPITERQKQLLKDVVPQALSAELGKLANYELTDKPGRDVLVVWSAMLDIVSRVPPEPIGRGASFVRTLGEATLIVELHDSMTDEVLARAMDRRVVSPAFVQRSTAPANQAEVRSAARRWAGDLRRQLDEFARL